jgi:hypothetical protein
VSIQTDELIDAFSDSLGEQKAQRVIDDAAREAGLAEKRRYSEDEAMTIADRILDQNDVSAFVRVSANTLKTRIRSGNVGS